MSNDNSTFTIKIDSKGGDSASRDLGKVNKTFEDLTKTAKMTVKELEEIRKRSAGIASDFQNVAKGASQVSRELNQLSQAERNLTSNVQAANRELATQIQQLKVVSGMGGRMNVSFTPPPGGGGMGPRIISGGAGNVGVGGSGGGGGIGAAYNGPVSGGRPGGIGGMPWKTIGGYVMSGLQVANAALGMYGQHLQHTGRHMAEDKLMGASNLVRAQSYRNHLYDEAMSSPMGWVGIKRNFQMRLRTRDSERTEVDDQGNLVGSQAGAQRAETGKTFTSAAARMTGEGREISGEKVSALSQGIAGALKIVGSAGAGFLLGGPVGAAIGAGTALMSGAGSQIMGAYHGYKHADRKLATGDLEAQQAESAVKASQLTDAMMHILKRQIQKFESMSGESVSLGRQTLGAADWALGAQYGGFSSGEIGGVIGGLRRGYGGMAGGKTQVGAVMSAGRSGMDLGVGTQIVGASASSGSDGAKNLERIFAAGIKQGMGSLEMGFFEKLGGAFAESLYSGSGGNRDIAIGAQLFAGLGPNPSRFAVEENAAGQTQMDRSIFRGNNYFSSRSLAEASNVLGADGKDISNVDIMSLAESSFQDLAGAGSSRLRAVLGQTMNDDQVTSAIQNFRSRRINMLGDVIGGPMGAKVQGAGGLEKFMQGIVGTLGNKDTSPAQRAEATKTLQALGMTLAKTLGEENAGGIEGLLRGMGASGDDAAKAFAEGRGKLPGVVSALDANVSDNARRRNFEERRKGKAFYSSQAGRDAAMKVLEGDNDLMGQGPMTPQDQAIYERLKSGKASGAEVQQILERANRAQAEVAEGAGDGYDATQKLVGEMAKLIPEISALVKALNRIPDIKVRPGKG